MNVVQRLRHYVGRKTTPGHAADYGDRRGPQGHLHVPRYTRGCYYGPEAGRDGPCVRCQLGLLYRTLKLAWGVRRQ